MRCIARTSACNTIPNGNILNAFVYGDHCSRAAVSNCQRLVESAAHRLYCRKDSIAADLCKHISDQVRTRTGLLQ